MDNNILGNKDMSCKTYQPKTSRLSFRIIAYVLSLLTIIMPVAPSLAAQLADSEIESQFGIDPVYDWVNSYDYQYQTPTYIENSTPNATHIKSFYKKIKDEYKVGLGSPKYVPIMINKLKIIIPKYPRYKYIGTPVVQSRYIRTQVNALLGRTLIDASNSAYASEAAQLNTLYSNAIGYIKSTPNLVFGDKLGRHQDGSGLSQNMVWPEVRQINGQNVIVPIVYLSQSTVDQHRVVNNQTTFNGNVSVGSLTIDGVTINTGRNTFIQVANDLYNGGTINGAGELKIVSGGALTNLSGRIQSEGDLVIGAHSIHSQTLVHRFDNGFDQGYRYGEIAAFNSTNGDVTLRSYSDIIFQGATSSAGGELTLVADGSIYLGSEQLYSGHQSRYEDSGRSSVSYLQSSLSAEDTIKLIANGTITIDAAKIVSDEGHIELLAGMGITVEDELAHTRSYKKGTYGKREINQEAYQTVAIRSVLDAGKGIRLHTALGDITLKATDIASMEGTSVTASSGSVNMLMAVETDHYSYSEVNKRLFTTKTTSQGYTIENAVPNTIIGGFQAEALYGLNVEYEGNRDLSFDDQINELSQMPGMEWMSEVRNSGEYSDVNWSEVSLAYEEWNETNTMLSPAAMVLITIVVAVATQGAGSGFAEAILGAGNAAGPLGTAIAAGTSSLISQVSLAVANGAVNGDIAGALQDFASVDTLKSLAIAMVTAAAISYVDTEFFTPSEEALDIAETTAKNAAQALEGATLDSVQAAGEAAREVVANGSLGQQAIQAVTHSAVNAGVTTIVAGGGLSDFSDIFINTLASNALSRVAKQFSEKIGEAYDGGGGDIGLASRYIAHAALGCAFGAAQTAIDNGDSSGSCASGVGGAIAGELTADLYVEITTTSEGLIRGHLNVTEDEIGALIYEWKRKGVNISRLVAAITVAMVGGDANIATMVGANAAAHNGFGDDVTDAIAEKYKNTINSLAQLEFYRQYIELSETNQSLISINSMVYGGFDEILRSSDGDHIQTDWFAAASAVTTFWGGLGGLDAPLSSMLASTDGENLMQYVSFHLAIDNQKTYETLLSGQELPGYEGLRGDELDRALVNKEQALVSTYMEEFFSANPTVNREEALSGLSRQFDPEYMFFGLNINEVESAIRTEFEENNIKFDISNEDHRIKLGHRLMDDINSIRNQE